MSVQIGITLFHATLFWLCTEVHLKSLASSFFYVRRPDRWFAKTAIAIADPCSENVFPKLLLLLFGEWTNGQSNPILHLLLLSIVIPSNMSLVMSTIGNLWLFFGPFWETPFEIYASTCSLGVLSCEINWSCLCSTKMSITIARNLR